MTWSLTLAGLPSAGEISKLHYYKKLQKTKDISITWVLTGKQFEYFRRTKEPTHYSRPFKKTQCNRRPVNRIFEYGPCNQEELNRIKIEKKHSD